jgi:two-component system response regulator LytT
LKVGICDDEIFYLEALEKNINKYAAVYGDDISVVKYNCGEQIVQAVADAPADFQMIFLDVEMPKWDGIKTAIKIREVSDDIVICFVTSHKGYSLKAFQVGAIGYIVKPVDYNIFEKVMNRAKILIEHTVKQTESQRRYIDINVNKKVQTVDTNQILYIEKSRNRSIVYLEDGEIVCYETLKNIYEKLDNKAFVYTNQGIIVKFSAIKEVRKDSVCLGNGMEVRLSRSYQKQVLNRYNDKFERLKADKNRE